MYNYLFLYEKKREVRKLQTYLYLFIYASKNSKRYKIRVVTQWKRVEG